MRPLPDLNPLIDRLLGLPYAELRCRPLVARLFQEGFGIDLDAPGTDINQYFQEIWFDGDPRDPLPLVQPWDLWVQFTDPALRISQHVALVVDSQRLFHALDSPVGAARTLLRSSRPKLLQVSRYREVL